MKYDPIPYLLDVNEPWIRYLTLKNLHNGALESKKLGVSKDTLLNVPMITESIEMCLKWDDTVLKRHNDATHPIHRLEILAEFGFTKNDPGLEHIAERILKHQTKEGAFQSNILIPKTFKGTGIPKWDWMTCDAPILLYFLSEIGYRDDSRVQMAAEHLVGLFRKNGLGCHSSIPKFRGPGRKDDHCPYANLIALKALAGFKGEVYEEARSLGIQAQIDFWNNKGKRKIFLFGIGTDFKKLKYPNVYYGIVHVLDVLSLFKKAQETSAFKEMLDVVNNKQARNGSFTPESVWMAFKGHDYGQRRNPSPTLTYKIAIINKRCH